MANTVRIRDTSTGRADQFIPEVQVGDGTFTQLTSVPYAEMENLTGITATPAEINKLDGAPLSASFTIGSESGGDTINVAIQLKDGNGSDLAVRGSVLAYLSDDANGDAIATSAPSGHWAIGTDGLLIPIVTDKCALLVSEADGDIDVNIVEAGAATWYVILALPNGKLQASAKVQFAG